MNQVTFRDPSIINYSVVLWTLGFCNLIKQLIEGFVFDCSFEQLHFKPSKPDCDQMQWTRSTSGTAQDSSLFTCQQKSSHHIKKSCAQTPKAATCSPPACFRLKHLFKHTFSPEQYKNIIFPFSASLKCINCFLTHCVSEMFFKAFSV